MQAVKQPGSRVVQAVHAVKKCKQQSVKQCKQRSASSNQYKQQCKQQSVQAVQAVHAVLNETVRSRRRPARIESRRPRVPEEGPLTHQDLQTVSPCMLRAANEGNDHCHAYNLAAVAR